MSSAITCSNISKSFGNKRVLDNIDLEITAGEIFGLLGPSGAGKTTLIKIITGQLAADRGKARIGKTESQKLSGNDYKSYGIMMDDFGLYERLSCFQNLKVFARIYGIDNGRIREVLSSVGLAGDMNKPVAKLSKGMKSRLKLARVFMIDPSVLFLDEPTSGLDPSTAEDIHHLIEAERKRGKTIFLTTHNMTEAEKLCDHIALLNEGVIVEYGTVNDICKRFYHQRLFNVELNNGEKISIPQNESAADRIFQLLKQNQIATIHSAEPNLETIFLELTGRTLAV